MPPLQLYLLGPPHIENNGQPLRITRRKGMALLSYLAVTGEHQPREKLATLLWPEHRNALALLRRELWDLNQVLGSEWLVTEQRSIGLRHDVGAWVDVWEFESCLRGTEDLKSAAQQGSLAWATQLSAAVNLYLGDFLTGFTIADAPEFDQWHYFQAEHFRQQCARALEFLIELHYTHNNLEQAITNARRLLALDPLSETTHRRMMLLFAQMGHQAAALRQYQECERLLETELDVQPEEETRQLYEDIRRRKIAPREGKTPRLAYEVREAPPAIPEPTETGTQTAYTSERGENRIATVLYVGICRDTDAVHNLFPDEMAEKLDRLIIMLRGIQHESWFHIDYLPMGGVLALFGVPQIHEDDPERAVRTALAIQQMALSSGVEISIGISTGLIYVGPINPQSLETLIIGAVVNFVTQLQAKARTGTILVSNSTHRFTRHAFDFAPMTVRITGMPDTAIAYQVLRPHLRGDKARGIEGLRANLIGRDAELSQLVNVQGRILAGDGQLVLVIGEAGIGKSRLVAELKATIENQAQPRKVQPQSLPTNVKRLVWLEGRCQEMIASVGYHPFRDLLSTYFAWRVEDNEAVRAQRVMTSLQALKIEGHLSAQQIETIGPLLGNLFALHFGSQWDERLQSVRPEQLHHQTLQALYDLLIALAGQQPVVLVLEDLHWADNPSLDLIAKLMQALHAVPLLLLCVYRPERDHRCWQLATLAARRCPERLVELALRELTPQQSRELMASLLATTELPATLQEAISGRSNGNPFFAEEIIYLLIDAGLLHREGNRWNVHTDVNTFSVPESVQSVILSRMDRLQAPLKQILQKAAVIGPIFPLQILAHMLPAKTNMVALLTDLIDAALIFQEQTVPETVYSFRHVLAQEAIYLTIPRSERMKLHQQVGLALEQSHHEDLAAQYEQLAYHFDRSEATEKAIAYLLKAGEKARRTYLNKEAIDYYGQALEHTQMLPDSRLHREWQLGALTGLALTYYRGTGQLGEAEGKIRTAIALAKEMNLPPRQLVRLYLWLGDIVMNWQPRYAETLRLGEEGLALFDEGDESVEVALMNALISFGYGMEGDLQNAYKAAMRIVGFADKLPFSEEMWLVYNAIFFAYFRERKLEESLHWMEIILHVSAKHNDLFVYGEAYCTLASIQACQGKLIESQVTREKGLQLLRQVGDVKQCNWAQMAMAWVDLYLGNLEFAEQSAVEALENAHVVNKEYLCDLHLLLGTIAHAKGEWNQAESFFHQAEQYREVVSTSGLDCHVALGYACLAQGEIRQAQQHFQNSVALTRTWPPVVEWRMSQGHKEVSTPFADALAGVELVMGNPETFRTFCEELRKTEPGIPTPPFNQWYLEATRPGEQFSIASIAIAPNTLLDLPDKLDKGVWTWRDPLGDSHFTNKDGLTLYAANGRDLWFNNRSAPCLLRHHEGAFIAQTICMSHSPELPAMGGLLIWKDNQNYLRLDWGSRGVGEITLLGCLDNKDTILGRGRLPQYHSNDPVFLRVEQVGQRVMALCSADGNNWFRVGQTEFRNPTTPMVGLYASSNIERTLYPGAFVNGTAIHFSGFWLAWPH